MLYFVAMKGINTLDISKAYVLGKPWIQNRLWQFFSAPRDGVCFLAFSALARKWNHHDGSAPLARLRIKHCMGFRQFLLRGQGKVSLEWSLVCLAYNFKRLYRMTGGKGLPEKVAI